MERGSVLVAEDADRATLARRVEGDLPRAGREDRVIAAEADALAGPEAGAPLAHDDLAAGHLLAGEHLDAEHVRVGFTACAGRAEAFLMCHQESSFEALALEPPLRLVTSSLVNSERCPARF